MEFLNEKQFLQLTKKGNLIPVFKEFMGDLDTPVSAYFKVASHSKYSFLLESVEGGEKVARYSFLARDPEKILIVKDRQLKVIDLNAKTQRTTIRATTNPLTDIRKLMAEYKFVNIPGLPRFCGGLIGYLGYDMVRYFERLPNKPKDDLKLPDAVLMLAKELVIFDHRHHKIQIVRCVHVPKGTTQNQKIALYRCAIRAIDAVAYQIHKPLSMPSSKNKRTEPDLTVTSNFSSPEFCQIVKQAQKEILNGEIIQVVLSQRFAVKFPIDPFHIYRTLRNLNPSPYMYFLNLNDMQIVGASPELLVRCENGLVETRPIAGTRWRGKDEQTDNMLSKELLADPKEKAEHIMLVDLGRNDLGRVCELGSVKVPEFMNVERYSHVMHIVSSVKGKLRKDKDAFDVLQAAFPAGTVSGAPKIRAMEIIDQLENVSRTTYAGCIGYFSFSGNLDSCITIRTVLVHKGLAYVQAGGGIVADSKPQSEYQESVNKAKAPILAMEMAKKYFA